jgi:hypothetical protein
MTLPLNEIREFLSESIRQKYGEKFKHFSKNIIDLHLSPQNFAMPIKINSANMQTAIENGDKADQLRAHIQFENTEEIQGICRVMARTHLNRQGVGGLTNRGDNRTLSPPVMNIFHQNFDPSRYTNWKYLIEDWLTEAEANTKINNVLFNESDIASLNELLSHNYEYALNSKNLMPGVSNSWRKISTGIYSGFIHLSKTYDLNAIALHKSIQEASNEGLSAINKLVESTSSSIEQYGIPLASSFLADLGIRGSENFVKADVHVTDAVKQYYGDKAPSGQNLLQFSFDKLCESSNDDLSPRAIDKLLYLCGSTKFYLLGSLPTLNEFTPTLRKNDFLAMLRQLGERDGHQYLDTNSPASITHKKSNNEDIFHMTTQNYVNQIQNAIAKSNFMNEIKDHIKKKVPRNLILKALEKHPPETYQTSRGIFW